MVLCLGWVCGDCSGRWVFVDRARVGGWEDVTAHAGFPREEDAIYFWVDVYVLLVRSLAQCDFDW